MHIQNQVRAIPDAPYQGAHDLSVTLRGDRRPHRLAIQPVLDLVPSFLRTERALEDPAVRDQSDERE